jgi:cyanophycinase
MKTKHPKGTLIPIGGGEDKSDRIDVLKRVVEETGKKKPKICLITLATGLPEEVAQDYRNAFDHVGTGKIYIIHYKNRIDADTDKNIDKIMNCDAIMFSGGDQLKLSSLLGGTKLIQLMKERYYNESNFVIAGTSAGAAAMSDTMIISGSSSHALVKGELELTNGLDFMDSVFIDTHFTERGRIGRLIHTVTCNPGVLGIGLGEDTAIILKAGDQIEVIGSGLVMIVDGTAINYTDLTEISNGEQITVQNVKVHVLGTGKQFCLTSRQLIPRPISANA